MSVQSVGPADVIAQIERVKAGWVERFTLWCVLLGIFKHATGKRLIFASPCAGIQLEAIIGKRPEIKKRLMLSADEFAVLMNAQMKPDNLLSVRVLLATGVRVSELFTALREKFLFRSSLALCHRARLGRRWTFIGSMRCRMFKGCLSWQETLSMSSCSPTNSGRAYDGDAHVSKMRFVRPLITGLRPYSKIRRSPHDCEAP
jgi:integrase